MPGPRDIAVLVGSLRRESYSRKVARALQALAPAALKLQIVEIGDLTMYNEDVDAAGAPPAWTTFRERIKAADGLIFVTPEYNRSVPGVLKNALDVGSRPYGQGAWNGKPGAVVSVSPGTLGAFGANHHLRQSLVFVDVLTLQQPEVYLASVGGMFDAAGALTSEPTREFLAKFLDAFARWVDQHAR
jgi:chromate reductase, NAD(P)H dehydrogenase (quinone)